MLSNSFGDEVFVMATFQPNATESKQPRQLPQPKLLAKGLFSTCYTLKPEHYAYYDPSRYHFRDMQSSVNNVPSPNLHPLYNEQ